MGRPIPAAVAPRAAPKNPFRDESRRRSRNATANAGHDPERVDRRARAILRPAAVIETNIPAHTVLYRKLASSFVTIPLMRTSYWCCL
jgi:hypothetical protein